MNIWLLFDASTDTELGEATTEQVEASETAFAKDGPGSAIFIRVDGSVIEGTTGITDWDAGQGARAVYAVQAPR
jgi:hypothetical protein